MGANHELRLLTGGANSALAGEIAAQMKVRLTDVQLSRFADGEIFVKINENVRGRDVFIVQSTNPPAENLLELLLLIDASDTRGPIARTSRGSRSAPSSWPTC